MNDEIELGLLPDGIGKSSAAMYSAVKCRAAAANSSALSERRMLDVDDDE